MCAKSFHGQVVSLLTSQIKQIMTNWLRITSGNGLIPWALRCLNRAP